MKKKIIGATVGTPIKPQAVIEKTEQAAQITKNTEDIKSLSEGLKGKQPKGDYALKNEIPTTPSQVGADAQGTAESLVGTHNTNTSAHSDIRLALQDLQNVINEFFAKDADADDTIDRLIEVVTLINSNKDLIDSIATNKVNVSDIIDNLTTNVTNKPLSAAQGVALKALIDALSKSKLDTTALTDAINTALAQAKASGEFDGAVGDDYVLTDQDKQEIADLIDTKGYLTEVPSNYVTESELNDKGYLTEHQSLAGYAKTSDIPDVSNLAKKSEIPDISGKADKDHTHEEYLTAHQDISHLAKKSEIPDVSNLAKKSEIPDISGKADKSHTHSEYLTSGSLSGYAKKSDIPTKVSNLDNDKGYLTKDTLEGVKTIITTDGEELKIFVNTYEKYQEYISAYGSKGLFAIITNDPNTANLNVLADTVAGILDGTKSVKKADSATKATQDSNGDNISTTYLKKIRAEERSKITSTKSDDGYIFPITYAEGKTYNNVIAVSGYLNSCMSGDGTTLPNIYFNVIAKSNYTDNTKSVIIPFRMPDYVDNDGVIRCDVFHLRADISMSASGLRVKNLKVILADNSVHSGIVELVSITNLIIIYE